MTVDPADMFVELARAYVLGEKPIDVKFKNAIIDTFVAVGTAMGYNPIGERVDILYEGTPEGSPARKLVVDACGNMPMIAQTGLKSLRNVPRSF
jgi:hypothetical protein